MLPTGNRAPNSEFHGRELAQNLKSKTSFAEKDGNESTESTQVPLKDRKSFEKKNTSKISVLSPTKQSSRGYTTSQMADASDTSQMANASDTSQMADASDTSQMAESSDKSSQMATASDESLRDEGDVPEKFRFPTSSTRKGHEAPEKMTASHPRPKATPDLQTQRDEAVAWLESLPDNDDDRAVATSLQNTVIPPGVLKNNIHIWKWMLHLIDTDQQKHTDQQSANGLTPLDCAKVLDYIQNGVSFELKEGMHLQNIPRATRRNFIPAGPQMRWFHQQGRQMVAAGMLRKMTRQQAHLVHACFLVPKGDGWRLIVDFKLLNEFLQTKPFSLPTLRRCRYAFFDLVSHDTIDLTSGYQHLNLHPDWYKYCCICIDGVIYAFICAPFGLSPLPQIFQEVASVPVRINNLIGMSAELLTPQDYHDMVRGTKKLPEMKSRAKLIIHQYLDDYSNKVPSTLRLVDRTQVPLENIPLLAAKLSMSLRALMTAAGFTIGNKSCTNGQITNPFVGFNIITQINGGKFGIPVKKVVKNATIFKKALAAEVWSFRTTAALASRILQFKVVWGFMSTMLARPLYSHLAREMKAEGISWNSVLSPSLLDREMIQEALELLEGTDSVLEAPVIDKWEEKVTFWDQQQWANFKDRDGNEPGLLFGDASDVQVGAFLTHLPMNISNVEHEIVKFNQELQFWKNLTIDERVAAVMEGTQLVFFSNLSAEERLCSSAYRELVLIDKLYADKKCRSKIRIQLKEMQRHSMLHLTDSKAVKYMLQKGASQVPECHRLIMRIMKNTRQLRYDYGLFFGWRRRNHHLAEVADGFSKTAAWRILPEIFQQWDAKHHYTLDAYAALDERVHRADGTPLHFCSRSTHDESEGDGRTTSWQSQTVWAFPPPRVQTLVLDAMRRCKCHRGKVTLVIAGWFYHQHKTQLLSLPWTTYHYRKSGSATRQHGLVPGTTTVRFEEAQFFLYFFHFDNDGTKNNNKNKKN